MTPHLFADVDPGRPFLTPTTQKESVDLLYMRSLATPSVGVGTWSFSKSPLSYPFDFWEAVDFVSSQKRNRDTLTLRRAVDETLLNHWLFKLAEEELKLASKDHLRQWALYLPSLKTEGLNSAGWQGDRVSLGGVSYKSYGGISLNRLIFSDPALLGMADPKTILEIEKFSRKSQELDIVERVTKTYFAYLKTKTLFQVELARREAIEQNLRIAKRRHELKISSKQEVYRWRSEFRNAQTAVLESEQMLLQVRMDLNQMMTQGQEFPFKEEVAASELVHIYLQSNYLNHYLSNMKVVMVIVPFMVQMAIEDSPEIRALDKVIHNPKREVQSAVSRFFLPTDSFTGDMDALNQKKENAKSGPLDYLEQRDAMRRLKLKKRLKVQEIERNVRSAAYDIHYSLSSVHLTREAMAQSREDYKSLQAQYREGFASFGELWDGQEDFFSHQKRLVKVLSAFLKDLTTYERSISHFYILQTSVERQEWLGNLDFYLEEKDVFASEVSGDRRNFWVKFLSR